MNSATYLEILKRRLLRNFPTLTKSPLCFKYHRLIYQQDGTTAHTAESTKSYFKEREIEVLDWPVQSPNLNLIESVWSKLKGNLRRTYEDVEELEEDIVRSYESIDCFYIQNLYFSLFSMRRASLQSTEFY